MEIFTPFVSSLTCALLLGTVGVVGGRARPQTDALPHTPQATASTPASNALTLEQRADIFMARKDYTDAVDFYTRALAKEAVNPVASSALWNKLGIAYQEQDVYTAARKSYQKAVKLNSNLSEAWNNLGTTYFFENKYGKSIKFYEHAIAVEPNSPSYHVNLGTSYTRMHRYGEAVQEYRVALTLDPTIFTEHGTNGTVMEPRSVDAEYYFYLAKVFASLGRTPEAVRYLRRAFEDGFDARKRLDTDPDFLKISKDPDYIALRKSPPIALKD